MQNPAFHDWPQDRGEEASQLATKLLYQELQKISENEDPLTMTTNLEEFTCVVNDAICDRNDNEERYGYQRMGTTLVMALAYLHQLYIVNLGDSRAYWITPSRCYQVTVDDDIASHQVRLGKRTEELSFSQGQVRTRNFLSNAKISG